MVETVQRNAALTVSLPVYATGLQVIAPEDVYQDGQEANVTNVRIWMLYKSFQYNMIEVSSAKTSFYLYKTFCMDCN